MKKILTASLATLTILFASPDLWAHCEMPCGVYDDAARFESMLEHVKTIEKAMVKIDALSQLETPDYHGISRWTTTKETHAQNIQHIVASYFLTQRVKAPKNPEDEAEMASYVTHLTLLHEITVAAMKTKQFVDIEKAEKLHHVITEYQAHYFIKHGHAH